MACDRTLLETMTPEQRGRRFRKSCNLFNAKKDTPSPRGLIPWEELTEEEKKQDIETAEAFDKLSLSLDDDAIAKSIERLS